MFYFSFTEELKPKYRSILKINNARSSDAGLYVCKASFEGHIVQTEARVTIQKQSRQVKSKKIHFIGNLLTITKFGLQQVGSRDVLKLGGLVLVLLQQVPLRFKAGKSVKTYSQQHRQENLLATEHTIYKRGGALVQWSIGFLIKFF